MLYVKKILTFTELFESPPESHMSSGLLYNVHVDTTSVQKMQLNADTVRFTSHPSVVTHRCEVLSVVLLAAGK